MIISLESVRILLRFEVLSYLSSGAWDDSEILILKKREGERPGVSVALLCHGVAWKARVAEHAGGR